LISRDEYCVSTHLHHCGHILLCETRSIETDAPQHFRAWKTVHHARQALAEAHPGIFLLQKKIHGSIDFS